jgi:hypothetical protein
VWSNYIVTVLILHYVCVSLLTFTSLRLVLLWQLFYLFCSSIVINTVIVTAPETLSRNERGRFGALKSDSTHHFFRNACTKSGSLRFLQFSGCWLILSVYILMSFDFPFVRLFGVRLFCFYPYLSGFMLYQSYLYLFMHDFRITWCSCSLTLSGLFRLRFLTEDRSSTSFKFSRPKQKRCFNLEFVVPIRISLIEDCC